MRSSVSFGCGRRDDLINTLNFIANIAILYISAQILGVSRNNAGYNARIMSNTDKIVEKLNNGKKEK